MTDAGLMAPRWTKADDARMAQLLAEGRTARQVGRVLGRTRSAVLRRGVTLRARAAAQSEPPRPAAGRRARKPAVAPRPAPPATYDDIVQAAAAVENARAALTRAHDRHRAAMETVLKPLRAAIAAAGLIEDLHEEDADEERLDPAWALVDHLRRRGIELRKVA